MHVVYESSYANAKLTRMYRKQKDNCEDWETQLGMKSKAILLKKSTETTTEHKRSDTAHVSRLHLINPIVVCMCIVQKVLMCFLLRGLCKTLYSTPLIL